jgi:hypothetical protein
MIAHAGTECSGTYSVGGKGSVQIIMLGTTAWVKPDDALWQSSGIPAAVLPRVSGKWVRSSTSASGVGSLAATCSLTKLLDSMQEPAGPHDGGTIAIGGSMAA